MNKIHINLIESNNSGKNYKAETVRFHAVRGQLRVDDMSLLKNEEDYYFDFMLLLLQQDITYPINIYTCECGVADCINILEKVNLIVTNDTVQWKFPKQFYGTHIHETFKGSDDLVVLEFDKEQYFNELSRVEHELIILSEKHSNLAVYPAHTPAQSCTQKLTVASMQMHKQAYKSFIEKQIARQETYGSLLQSYIKLDFDTEIWTCHFDTLADLYASYKGYDSDEQKQAYIKDILVPELRENQTNLLDYIKKLDLTTLQACVSIDYKTEDSNVDTDTQPLPDMKTVSLKVLDY